MCQISLIYCHFSLILSHLIISDSLENIRGLFVVITDGWMALEDEEEDEEEGGDSDDEKDDSDSSGETDDSELEEIFELF